jgi:hypothetical protein
MKRMKTTPLLERGTGSLGKTVNTHNASRQACQQIAMCVCVCVCVCVAKTAPGQQVGMVFFLLETVFVVALIPFSFSVSDT